MVEGENSPDNYSTSKIIIDALIKKSRNSKFVSDHLAMFLIEIRLIKCVIKLFQKMMECYRLFLSTKRIKKCVTKLLIIIFLQYNLFLTAIRLK